MQQVDVVNIKIFFGADLICTFALGPLICSPYSQSVMVYVNTATLDSFVPTFV